MHHFYVLESANSSLLTKCVLLGTVKNVFVVISHYFDGNDDARLVGPVVVMLGVTLVPAGLSQFYKDTLNPVQ